MSGLLQDAAGLREALLNAGTSQVTHSEDIPGSYGAAQVIACQMSTKHFRRLRSPHFCYYHRPFLTVLDPFMKPLLAAHSATGPCNRSTCRDGQRSSGVSYTIQVALHSRGMGNDILLSVNRKVTVI